LFTSDKESDMDCTGTGGCRLLIGWLAAVVIILVGRATEAQSLDSERFVELRYGGFTSVYDLRTVRVIQPGKFTIIVRATRDPDDIRIKVRVLDALRPYCDRPDGHYPPPREMVDWTLVDMPVDNITVHTKDDTQFPGHPTKVAKWTIPIKRLALFDQMIVCQGQPGGADTYYSQARQALLDGISSKELFDCKRGIVGTFLLSDPSKVELGVIPKTGLLPASSYIAVCQKVTGARPYIPPD